MSSQKLEVLSLESLQESLYRKLRNHEAKGFSNLSEASIASELMPLLVELARREPKRWQRFSSGYLSYPDSRHRRVFDLLSFLEHSLKKGVRETEFLSPYTLEEGDLEKAQAKKIPCVVILNNIRSAFNVGSIFRAAECAGFLKVYLCGYTAEPETSALRKSAMGCEKLVSWEYRQSAESLLHELKAEGYQVVGLETIAKAESYRNWKPQDEQSLALLVGNEAFGIEETLLSLCDHYLRIPMFGQKNSLNVAQAFSLVAFEWSIEIRGRNEEL